MKKKSLCIAILIIGVVLVLIARFWFKSQIKTDRLEVIDIEPISGSQIMASSGKMEITIHFSGEIGKNLNGLKLIDNFGLTWEKEILNTKTVLFLTRFGKEIMTVEELKIELFLDNNLIKGWSYQVPLDEKAMGKAVEALIEEDASFIPSVEDITYFKEEDDKTNLTQPLWQLLPIETNKYKISHYIEPLKLVIYLKNETKKEDVLNEIKTWIKDNGGNENEHKLEFRD